MLCKIVILLTLSVICTSSQCDQGCQNHRQYTRVKRGKFYSSPPIRFYNLPPMPLPIKGPFSYTPPPFMTDDSPSYSSSPYPGSSYPGSPYPGSPYPGSPYPGSPYPGRPYKVSKRPPVPYNDGLGDDDITNLVKHLSKQDLDKILEFAQEKGQSYTKYTDVYDTNELSKPFKRESRIVYKGNDHTKYEEPTSYKEETKFSTPQKDDSNFSNFVTEPSYIKAFAAQERPRPSQANFRPNQRVPVDTNNLPASQTVPKETESFSPSQYYGSFQSSDRFPIINNAGNDQEYVFASKESQRRPVQGDTEKYVSYERIPVNSESVSPSQPIVNSNGPVSSSNNPFFAESNEEEKLPLPVNMRDDYDVSFTNNVPNIVKAESSSYKVENFGDLPLMDYLSKLDDVDSYHVPHYTVTQSKPSKPPSSPISFPSYAAPPSYSSPSSSSSFLKPSPAAAAIKEPVYERAPSAAAAADQSDAHLKAIKIWSHRSQGAAYTLHDDGTLTPERSRPKYG